MLDRYPFFKLCLVALLLGLSVNLRAEMKSRYNSQGNNVGISFNMSVVGSPMSSEYNGTGGDHQFPRGSGNLYRIGRISYGINAALDYDGDGVASDTVLNMSRGHEYVNMRQSLEYRDQILSLVAAGEDMESAPGRVSVNRIWTSLDAEDLATWPAEFREGRSEAGAPILHGAETVVSLRGNAFSSWGNRLGASIEYSYYFLNYAESNNMVYMHVFLRNMSEYCQYNPDPQFLQKIAGTASTGQTWSGMQMTYAMSYIYATGAAWVQNWAHRYYPKQIFAIVDGAGTNSNFSGYPYIMASHPLRLPRLRDQQLKLTNTNQNYWSTEFGFSPMDPMITSPNPGASYRFGLGRYDTEYPSADYLVYSQMTNPWWGGPCYGWPGVPEPGDSRSDQWIWGGTNAGFAQFWYGEFHDVAPRDSFSVDNVFMFVPAVSNPFVMPKVEYANIDDPNVQMQMGNVDAYADVADLTFGGGYILPETPAPPALTIIPGDKQVTVTWSDMNVNTPDAYYGFLQQHPELDPNHVYREYDFEGYRLYRSFVGPSDSHSELLMDCSLSADNIQFYFIDKMTDDSPLYRMNNGMKVWYALVPYDKNYDTGSGEAFSLPDPSSGKQWNRPGNGLYAVEPRSDASNYRAAAASKTTFQGQATVDAPTATLSGDGTGKLTSAPQWLMPVMPVVELIPVNNERVSQNISTYVTCDAAAFLPGGCNWPAGVRTIRISESSSKAGQPIDITVRNGSDEAGIVLNGPVDADGIVYALDVTFSGLNYSDLYFDLDKGSYDGASAVAAQYRCGPNINSAPNIVGWTRNAQYTVTWKNGSAGMLTLEVKDVTRNQSVDFGEQPDDFGWGFVPAELIGDRWGAGDNIYNQMANGVPKAERTNKMSQEIAADNTDSFGIYLNGIFWLFQDITAMPAAGATMTVTTVFGTWNDNQTEFTQYADPPMVGDSWKVEINASTVKAEDANLGKIKVVPNPYLASSFLDLSPDSRRIDFVNLPDRCTIRIYSMGGHLVNVLNHIGANRSGWGNYTDYDRLDSKGNPAVFTGYDNHGGNESWNLRNRFGQTVASGLYIFHVTDSRGKTFAGKFYIVN